MENIKSIPKEKFQFAQKGDFIHDKKLETKSRSYLQDAFSRFCKNKGSIVGAIIIIILVLFAIIVPFCTPYKVSYADDNFKTTLPKCSWFENTDFWDGCKVKTDGKTTFMVNYAMGLETGHNTVKNQHYTKTETGLYKYRLDTYHSTGVIYKNLSAEEYLNLQTYQNETGRQVIYPTIKFSERPTAMAISTNANYYFKTNGMKIEYDEKGNIIPNYWALAEGESDPDAAAYNSLRIAGNDVIKGDGFEAEGTTYNYVYGRRLMGGNVEVRVNYYEYYIYYHSYVLKDGITAPNFLFGTDSEGHDILTCLASGARFSFIFAIAVAAFNLVVGAIYGAIEGYYGGKVDIIMERISDILSSVPFMIVITLLKYHMGGASHILLLFISFFLTGWIGMAGSTRMQFYRFKNQEYVLAARTLGARDRRIMWKHIFPNAIGTLITSCALVIPSMIFSEVSLSYLGIVNLSTGNVTSVGTLIAAGQEALTTAPFMSLFPSVFLVLLMLSFNLFGNGLRDAFNPSLRGS